MTISSLQNPRVKSAAKLRDRRGRDTQQRIIIDGVREILLAVRAGVEILELFVCPEICRSANHKAVFAEAEKANPEIVDVTSGVLEKLSFGERSEGLVATAKPLRCHLNDLKLESDALIAVVQGVEKPGNLGAILRTADAAGVSAVVAADPVTDLFNPNVIRASLGAVFSVPTIASTSDDTIQWLRANDTAIYTARVEGSVTYADVDYRRRSAIVLGSESGGLSKVWQGRDMVPIALPMHGEVDSLNVSATAAVLFYEANRQRKSATNRSAGI